MTIPPPVPPGWQGPGYPPQGHPPGYPGYPPAAYPPPGYPGAQYPGAPWMPAWKPGIIPLRGLQLGDIFSGALAYIRANPAATLGLTALIVAVTSVVQLVVEAAGSSAVVRSVSSGLVSALATILLSGMLTVVVARAVLGHSITISEAWQRVRGRLPALIALAVLQIAAVALLVGAAVLVIAGVARAANGPLAFLVGFPLGLLTVAALAYLFTILSFAPVAIVLERVSVTDGIRRSIDLARKHFWRILGIRILAGLITTIVAAAVGFPFGIASALLSAGQEPGHLTLASAVLATIGGAIGQILTTPFSAGVVVLLYVDARIRSESFDQALRNAVAWGPAADDLWRPRRA